MPFPHSVIVTSDSNYSTTHKQNLQQVTSFTSATAPCEPCTNARDQYARSRWVSTRNMWVSTPFRVPERVPKDKTSPPPS